MQLFVLLSQIQINYLSSFPFCLSLAYQCTNLDKIAFTCFARTEGKMRKVENKMQEDARKQASLTFHHIAAECSLVIVRGLKKKSETFEYNRP